MPARREGERHRGINEMSIEFGNVLQSRVSTPFLG